MTGEKALETGRESQIKTSHLRAGFVVNFRTVPKKSLRMMIIPFPSIYVVVVLPRVLNSAVEVHSWQ